AEALGENSQHSLSFDGTQHANLCFAYGSQECPQKISLALKKTLLHDYRIAHHGHPFELAQDIVTRALELGGKVAGDEGAVNGAGFERPADNSHFAESGDNQFVLFRVQTKFFEDQHCGHPASAANAGDAEPFAAQVFGSLDLRLHD